MHPKRRTSSAPLCRGCVYGVILLVISCDGTLPSTRLRREVKLPIPRATIDLPGPERLLRTDRGEKYRLTPLALISIAFDRQPDIKSSYQRFKSEEGRYDFFVVSRDSLTPRFRTTNRFSESRADETVTRNRNHTVELSVEKRFFDTTELDVAAGLQTDAVEEAIGYHPFVSASLRYPLWVSRQKLERTSEEIFRRNELNDAQLDYIQEVRSRLQDSLFRFYDVIHFRQQVKNTKRWQKDLEDILRRIDAINARDVNKDRRRTEAERARVSAQVRERSGRFEIQQERLKAACGIPFHAKVELIEEPFNPFTGANQEDLLRLSIETDPEIATLRNEQRNSEVELELARKGRWDVALLLDGQSNLEGAGEAEGLSDWSATFGIDVSAVDPRVTSSLINQAQGRIARFKQAIIAQENNIFVNTLEGIIRIETLSASRKELIQSFHRFQTDYQTGLEEYTAGTLNIDDLLKRRETLFDQEQQIARLSFIVGANVAELCSTTGKFFELLETEDRQP